MNGTEGVGSKCRHNHEEHPHFNCISEGGYLRSVPLGCKSVFNHSQAAPLKPTPTKAIRVNTNIWNGSTKHATELYYCLQCTVSHDSENEVEHIRWSYQSDVMSSNQNLVSRSFLVLVASGNPIGYVANPWAPDQIMDFYHGPSTVVS